MPISSLHPQILIDPLFQAIFPTTPLNSSQKNPAPCFLPSWTLGDFAMSSSVKAPKPTDFLLEVWYIDR